MGHAKMKFSHLCLITSSIALMGLCVDAVNTARAQIRTQAVDYTVGDKVFEGFLAYDESIKDKRPGILIAHSKRGAAMQDLFHEVFD
jgi:hypothetical protein